MDQRPFVRLPAPRVVERLVLPTDLARFYSENEGIGRESDPDRSVRLCRLNEVVQLGWCDVHVLRGYEIPEWELFAAYRIGISPLFDEIVYVLSAPSCR